MLGEDKAKAEYKKAVARHLISEYENKTTTLPDVDPIEMIKIRVEDFRL